MGVHIDTGRLKELREMAALTQGALASKAGTSKRTIERLEQGWSGNLSTVKKIVAVLGVQAEDLLLPDEDSKDISRAPFADYFAAIKEVFGNVRFLGLAHRVDERNMPIEKLFVEPEVCDRYIDPNLPLAQWPKRQGLLEALAKNRRMVVLGDPGSGKSTIVSMIACMLADKRKNPWRQALDDAIPVPLILRELALPAKYSFDELLESLQQTELGRCLGQKDMRFVIDAVHEGRAILLLDGIDELSDVARREALHTVAWEGMRRISNTRVVMTSRITGHDTVPFQFSPEVREMRRELSSRAKVKEADVMVALESQEPLLYVTPFDDPRIELFALNWYRQREESERRAKERATNLTDAVRRDAGTTTLARIPNLLTLMALIHRLEADLPHGKARLYAKIVETYLETIDNYRKLTERPDSLLDKKRWLARVAFGMQRWRSEPIAVIRPDKHREILIGRELLHNRIAEGMAKSGKKSDEADIQAFIDHIQRRSGLLIERGAGQFAFTHLSFQEYFAAWHMSRLVPETPEFDELKRFVDDAAWLETFCFFFEIVADEQQERKEEIRRELLGTAWESGAPLPEKKDNKAMLLARLACDRYSGLDEHSVPAVDSCLRRELEEAGTELLRILLAAKSEGGRIVARLAELAAEKKVSELSLSCTPVADLQPLAGLTMLRELALDGMPVIDLKPMAELTKLQRLNLNNTPVSDLSPLTDLIHLTELYLLGTRVADLRPLARLAQLRWLGLEGTPVTDLTPLAGLFELHHLSLRSTSVTDLKPLAGLANLLTLELSHTSVPQAEMMSLKAALPNLIIYGP